jgi:Right handed beta helix region
MNVYGSAIVRVAALISALVGLGTTSLSAQTITVTTGDDLVDFGGAQGVGQLPGPDGLVSLREAATAANNTAGPQTIEFAIPRFRWGSLFPNHAECRIDNAIFLTDHGTTIDFTTQTALTGDTNPGGWEVAVFYAGATTFVSQFMVLADGCTIKGMDYVGGNSTGPSVRLYGSNNRIVASTRSIASVALDPSAPTPFSGNVIGGAAAEDRNELRLVWFVHGASGNLVIGNSIRSIKITGDTLFGTCNDNRIGGPTVEERNIITGNGGSGEEGIPTGIQVEIKHAVGTIIEGNYIGTSTDGMTASAMNGVSGVNVGLGAVGTIIRDNLISGIARTGTFHYAGVRFGTGIVVTDGSSNTRIVGNRLGENADGSAHLINVQGMLVARSTTLAAPVTGVSIGGAAPGDGNTVTGSEQAGIVIHSTVAGVRISGNSVFGNGTLGIDLMGGLGVTPNDAGDADGGGNNLQNFPVVSGADATPAGLLVHGTFGSLANQAFMLEFFLSPTCDPSGHGEGQFFVGAVQVQTGADGQALFDEVLAADASPGWFATATATRVATGDTSEFSACVAVTEGGEPVPGDVDGDGHVGLTDLALLLTAFGSCSGDPGFNPGADFDANGCIELTDLATLLGNFGV